MNREQEQALTIAAKMPANRQECPDHDFIFMQGYLAGVASVTPASNKDKAFDQREREHEARRLRHMRQPPRC